MHPICCEYMGYQWEPTATGNAVKMMKARMIRILQKRTQQPVEGLLCWHLQDLQVPPATVTTPLIFFVVPNQNVIVTLPYMLLTLI